MNRWVDRVDRLLDRTLIALMGAMVVNVLWQVLTRYVLRSPSSYTEELARFLLIWLGLFGACHAYRHRMHIAIEVVVERLGVANRRAAAVVSLSLVALFAVSVMVIGGLVLVRLTLHLGQTSAALGAPLGYIYLALPLAGALLVFYTVAAGIERVRGEETES